MSITEPSTVDALGIDEQTGEAVLTISDHLDWDNEGAHLLALENKINAYLSFAESGQLAETLDDATEHPIRISLIHKYQPTPRTVQVLERPKADLREGGYAFKYTGLPDGY